ncbi:uncharacterized protein PSFLO_05239 [Pseudozyma flocculosa]|uniref:Uncharacterized protein n=1 Tax=Pseudozyma flocculosa TaxID=84751 RepID=A0A5C3F5J2_9BASI|nr:uncharacterized protein PSFLO_05239 [Pseudozyma flocculosa]
MKLSPIVATLSLLALPASVHAQQPAVRPHPAHTPYTFQPLPGGATNVRYYRIDNVGTLRLYTDRGGVRWLSFQRSDHGAGGWWIGKLREGGLFVELSAATEVSCGSDQADSLFRACRYFGDPAHARDFGLWADQPHRYVVARHPPRRRPRPPARGILVQHLRD